MPVMAEAVIGPIPGMVASRRLTAFDLCSRMITASIALMRISRALSSAKRLCNASRANAGTSVVSTLQQIDQISDAVPTRRAMMPKLAKMTANRIYQHGSLPHQQVACSMVQKCGLLMRRLHRNETHSRPADRLADRLGICSIGCFDPHP